MAEFLGSVFDLGASYRAHFYYSSSEGRGRSIYGPRRGQKRRAEEDLELMRAAARGKTEKQDIYAAVAAEVRGLQERAEWESTVSAHHASDFTGTSRVTSPTELCRPASIQKRAATWRTCACS